MRASIDHFFADLETEKSKSVDHAGPRHHDSESSEEHLVTFLGLFGCAVQRSSVIWLLERVSLQKSLNVVNWVNEGPEADTGTCSCNQRTSKVHLSLMREVLDHQIVNSEIKSKTNGFPDDCRVKSKVKLAQSVLLENCGGHFDRSHSFFFVESHLESGMVERSLDSEGGTTIRALGIPDRRPE